MKVVSTLLLLTAWMLFMNLFSFSLAQEPVKQNPVDSTSLKNPIVIGQDLYNTHCHKCHVLKDPAKRSKDKWERILPKMAKKAKLTTEQQNLITQYVMSVAKED